MNPMNTNAPALNPANPQNEVNPKTFRNYNTFPMSYTHHLTARYGDVTPFYAFESWSSDKVPFASFHELRNYTMRSPMMNKLKMLKDYFLVPMEAILPRTWEYYIANPTQNEDIPDNAAPYISNLANFYYQFQQLGQQSFYDILKNSGDYTDADVQSLIIKYFIAFENVVSDGGLFSLLGCKLSKYFYVDTNSGIGTLDSLFQLFYSELRETIKSGDIALYIPHTDTTYYLLFDELDSHDPRRVSWHRYLELMRENSDFILRLFLEDEAFSFMQYYIELIKLRSQDITGLTINVSRFSAYQIACHHFMSNDKVDSIYSADLCRSMFETFYLADNPIATYEMNGVTHLYDVFSNKYLTWAFGAIDVYNLPADTYSSCLNRIHYLYALTSFRKSLKFGDYFTGSRPRPLAVGDVNAPVTANGVSAIDITKKISVQRFLNAVNKTGRKLSEYVQQILGGYVAPVSTDPKFLARDTCFVGTQEVENTSSENQGNIVTNLRSEQSKYAFEAEVSEPSIILGLCSFEIARSYSKTIDRHFLHKDRFDMFNPYFQNIGDQEIFNAEKGLNYAKGPFAYSLRHMEYKQRFNISSGGFVEWLPSWAFIADNDNGTEMNVKNLSSDYIRSSNADFDRFYSSLTGSTLSSYFHFIIMFDNQSTPIRNMEYSPTIL